MISRIMIIEILAISSMLAKLSDHELLLEYAHNTAIEYNICPETIEAMIEIESEWNEDAVSDCGAIGLMQIIPKWQTDRMERLGITDLSDPYQNILCGCDYLSELCEKYGNIEEALMFYNMGYYGIELYEEGIIAKYAEDVLDRSMELEEEHQKKQEAQEKWKRFRYLRSERLNAISNR